MKLLVVLFCAFTGYFILSVAAEEIALISGLNYGDIRVRDIQDADEKFNCPFPFGSFADPEDCSHYYICMAGRAVNKRCPSGFKFCIMRRTCFLGFLAVCGYRDKKTTTTTSGPTGTPSEGKFSCPSFRGSFPHPEDCSKYYTCSFYIHTMKTCPENELFDAVQTVCRPADEVHCGDRQRPGHTTTGDITDTEPETEDITDEFTGTEDITDEFTGTEGFTDEFTDTEGITDEFTGTEDITDESTVIIEDTSTEPPTTPPKEITTTEKHRETAPPDTDCDENDVDCIIDETGDPDDWFICPKDIGAYPHPSSHKLFIFCMNWIPSVKKCGMDLVFSRELSTCIAVEVPDTSDESTSDESYES